MSEGRVFQSVGAATEKDLAPYVFKLSQEALFAGSFRSMATCNMLYGLLQVIKCHGKHSPAFAEQQSQNLRGGTSYSALYGDAFLRTKYANGWANLPGIFFEFLSL